jgi:hypothetical protein
MGGRRHQQQGCREPERQHGHQQALEQRTQQAAHRIGFESANPKQPVAITTNAAKSFP